MLRGVPSANDDAPGAVSDRDVFPILYAAIALWQGVDVLAKIPKTGLVVFYGPLTPTRFLVKRDSFLGRFAAGITGQHAAVQILQLRHPQAAMEFAGQPPRHPDVVGMHVRANDAFE